MRTYKELIEHAISKGNEFEPKNYLQRINSLLRYIEREPELKMHGPLSDYRNRVSQLMGKLPELDLDSLIILGGNICMLEHYVAGNKNLLDGIGIIPIGHALASAQTGLAYETLAEIARLSQHLDEAEIKKLHELAMKHSKDEKTIARLRLETV